MKFPGSLHRKNSTIEFETSDPDKWFVDVVTSNSRSKKVSREMIIAKDISSFVRFFHGLGYTGTIRTNLN